MLSQNFTEGSLSKLLYADNLVLMSETIQALRNKFLSWKAFESKGLKVNLGKTKVIASGGITKDGTSKREVDPCGVYRLKVKVKSDLCVECDKFIHGRCARAKRVTAKLSRNFAYQKCEGNVGEAVEQGEKLCYEVKNKGINISW